MSFLNVDKNKCKGDGTCVETCPIGIIRMGEKDRLPHPVEWAEKTCIKCGHCVSICPHGALSLDEVPLDKCTPLPKGWNLSPGQAELLLKGRRSIRVYKKDAVNRAILESLIDTARYAPSGINLQPVKWLIVEDPKKVHLLAEKIIAWMRSEMEKNSPLAESLRFKNIVAAWENGKDYVCRQAPHLIMSYALKEDMTAPQACTIGCTYAEIAAISHGLGTCWAGYVNMAVNMCPAVRDAVKLSRRCNCFGALLLGYPKYAYQRIPLRNPSNIVWR